MSNALAFIIDLLLFLVTLAFAIAAVGLILYIILFIISKIIFVITGNEELEERLSNVFSKHYYWGLFKWK